MGFLFFLNNMEGSRANKTARDAAKTWNEQMEEHTNERCGPDNKTISNATGTGPEFKRMDTQMKDTAGTKK